MPIVKTCPIRASASCRTDCAWFRDNECIEVSKARALEFLARRFANVDDVIARAEGLLEPQGIPMSIKGGPRD